MGFPSRFVSLAAFGAAIVAASSASAEPMDPALSRLVTNPECRTDTGVWNEAAGRCTGDNAAFKKLINQMGFAIAPSAMHSARTVGYGGFHLSLEGQFTKIDDGADYWQRGTQGPRDPSSKKASIINSSPSSTLQLYSAKIRKAWGFGFESMGQVGFVADTSIISGGADLRWSLLEGFRTGAPGVLPDIAVGGGVRTITGTNQYQLTVAGLDVQASKPLPIADSSIITPYIGYQYVWIFGDSGVIDLTPGTDAVGYCGYTGDNIPGSGDPNKTTPGGDSIYDGQPVCAGGSPGDFNNNIVFDEARLERQRMIFGVSYQYEMVALGAQFITDIVDPADAQNDDADKEVLDGEARQWSIVIELGAVF